MKDALIMVAGAGGFIGGHLVADLVHRGFTNIRAVDIKPVAEWYQVFDQVENVCADLRDRDVCFHACREAADVYNLAADMGGMGFIETRVDAGRRAVEKPFHGGLACSHHHAQRRLFRI